MRRKGPREGWAPIYVAAAVAVAAFALVLADDAGIAELGLPKHPGTSPAGRGL